MSKIGRKRSKAGYGFISPILLFYSIFFLFPVIFSLLASFRRWNGLVPFFSANYVGLDNYKWLLENDLFVSSVLNTVIYSIVTVLVGIFISLILAVLINNSKYASFWRLLLFLPAVTPPVAVGTIWGYLYRANNGLINQILGLIGIKPVRWLTDPKTALISIMITAIWAGVGIQVLIITASLQNIPQDYYDAAKIDGAGSFNIFWKITLPLLRPILLFLTATGMIGAWQVFDLPYIMGTNAPAKSVMTVSWYIYETAFQSLRMGRASAAAFILFCIIFIVTLMVLRAFRRGGIEGYE